jgi:hypothetical protein
MAHRSGLPRRALAAALLVAALLAGCGGATKHPAGTGASATATAPASKSAYQTRALIVLRPLLDSINAALKAPTQASVWQELHHRAVQAYATIKRLSPPAGVADLHRDLVSELTNVASTANGLFQAISSGDLSKARPLGERLVHEGGAITELGNRFKARGYTQIGSILAGP